MVSQKYTLHQKTPFSFQTSLYAASKVYCEGLITAFAEKDLIDATIFRSYHSRAQVFHGLFDFYKSLRSNPTS